MVHIINICPNFLAFWDVAANFPQNEQQRLWHTLYEEPHRAIFDVYYNLYGHPAGLEAALTRFDTVAPRLRTLLPHIVQAVEKVVPQCAQLFATTHDDVQFVLMVGLFASDSWATFLHRKLTSFLALEVEHNLNLRTVTISIGHEAAHTFHQQCSSFSLVNPTVGEGLFSEGLAILASTIVTPDAPEAAYLWPGGEHTITGQDCRAWVAACDEQWPEVRRWLLRDLDRTDRYPSYFYVYPKDGLPAGVPMRVGYVAGYRILNQLGQRYSVAEMARWSQERALTEVQQILAVD